MKKPSIAKLLGVTEEERSITSATNIKRKADKKAKQNADIAKLEELSSEEMRLIEESLDRELLRSPMMPTHGINY